MRLRPGLFSLRGLSLAWPCWLFVFLHRLFRGVEPLQQGLLGLFELLVFGCAFLAFPDDDLVPVVDGVRQRQDALAQLVGVPRGFLGLAKFDFKEAYAPLEFLLAGFGLPGVPRVFEPEIVEFLLAAVVGGFLRAHHRLSFRGVGKAAAAQRDEFVNPLPHLLLAFLPFVEK